MGGTYNYYCTNTVIVQRTICRYQIHIALCIFLARISWFPAPKSHTLRVSVDDDFPSKFPSVTSKTGMSSFSINGFDRHFPTMCPRQHQAYQSSSSLSLIILHAKLAKVAVVNSERSPQALSCSLAPPLRLLHRSVLPFASPSSIDYPCPARPRQISCKFFPRKDVVCRKITPFDPKC